MNLPGFPGNKKQGWSASGTLFQQGAHQVSLQCDFPFPTDYTAQFSITPKAQFGLFPPNSPIVPPTLGRTKTQAELSWKVEGNWVTRIISVSDGMTITGTGQAARIVLKDASPVKDPIPTQYDVSVQVAQGVRGSVVNLPFLEGPFNELPPGVLAVPVPQNSGITAIAVLVSSQTPAVIPDQSFQVQQINGLGVVAAYDPRQYFWIPLMPGVVTINLFNGTVGDTFNTKIIWGIDG